MDVFFVLSGYLITRLLTREIENNGRIDLPKFYGRRFLRLTPALWCVLAFATLRALASPLRDQQLLSVAVAFGYLMNWNRVFGWVTPGILSHTWSLAIEEQFYLVWPLTLSVIISRRPKIWIGALITIIVIWRCFLDVSGASFERIHNGFDSHADPIMIGCFLGLTPVSDRWLRLARRTVVIPILVLAVSLVLLGEQVEFVKNVGMDVSPVCTVWVILAAIEKGWIRSLLTQKFLTYTGKISYGWYLWHYPVLIVIGNALTKHHISSPYIGPCAGIVASYGVAVLSHHFVEKPFLRLKDRLHPADGPANRRPPMFRLPKLLINSSDFWLSPS